MKLILTREVAGLGLAGDIVEVADGYGRNFLVPRGSAILWSKGAEKQITQIRRARDAREIRDLGHAREIRSDLEKLNVTLGARAGEGGRLFGSITSADVATAVKDAGGPLLDRKRIRLPGNIKSTGLHTVTVELHPDVVASVPVTVTVCVQDTTWVSTSVAVHSIVVIPTGYGSVNATPSLRCAVIVAVAEFAVAVPTFTPVAGSQPVGDGTVTFAGQLIVRR